MMFSIAAVSMILLIINSSSAVKLKTSFTPDENDRRNWNQLWKVLKRKGATRIQAVNLTVFDRIILANARERATATKDDGLFIYQGDISMTKNEFNLFFGKKRQRTTRAVLKKLRDNRWPRNSLVYELHSSLTSKARKAIQAAIVEWENVLPCLGKWKDIKTLRKKPHKYIQFYHGKGCNSAVGRQGGVQKISIGKGCEKKIIAIHEIGHAMGMWHEQSRPDRDKYIRILWNNIIPAWRSAFRKIPPGLVDSYGVDYDYASVMHYPDSAFAKHAGLQTMVSRSGNRRLGNKEGLSSNDIKQVRMMYRCKRNQNQKVCQDSSEHCVGWKRHGFCRAGNEYYSYMKRNCCKTCSDVCHAKDKLSSCPEWSTNGYCDHSDYSTFMSFYCKKSCECK